VELIAVTLGARRRGAKGGEDGSRGWGCSQGSFYRAGDREAGSRGSNRSGSVELQGVMVLALILHRGGGETKGWHRFERGRGGGQIVLHSRMEGGGQRHQGGGCSEALEEDDGASGPQGQ
jgi:hypothetical protein